MSIKPGTSFNNDMMTMQLAGWSLTVTTPGRHDGEYKVLGCYQTWPVEMQVSTDESTHSTSRGRDLVRTSYLM